MAPERNDRRAHMRYQSSLDAEVSAYVRDGLKLIESTKLKDVSGGGARFASAHAGSYAIGQAVRLCIRLPGNGESERKIECPASVVWVDEGDSLALAESADASVSIAMQYVFDAPQIESLISHSGTPE